MFNSSVSRELSSRQMPDFMLDAVKRRVMEIGLWSESMAGSMVALARRERSVCERKK